MSDNKTNLWMIVGVVIVVAVLSSLITVNLTGNAIRSTGTSGFSAVQAAAITDMIAQNTYTKTYIDDKINTLSASDNSLSSAICAKYITLNAGPAYAGSRYSISGKDYTLALSSTSSNQVAIFTINAVSTGNINVGQSYTITNSSAKLTLKSVHHPAYAGDVRSANVVISDC